MVTKIITDQPDKYADHFQGTQVIDVRTFESTTPKAWLPYEHEYLAYTICDSFVDAEEAIAIDFEMKIVDKYMLAYHILTTFQMVVVVFVAESLPQNLEREYDFGLFRNKALKVKTKEQLLQFFSNKESLERYRDVYRAEFNLQNCFTGYQQFLSLDRHQATNEWGAIKLLLNHGMTLKQIEAVYPLPKTVYFKQKLYAHGINEGTVVDFNVYPKKDALVADQTAFLSHIPKVREVLLIDDNAENGWKFALETIFANAKINEYLNFEAANRIADFSKYDVIFLDLRLPAKAGDTTPDIEKGKTLIQKIKGEENALYVPLIVFTASQTARTLNDVLNLGADAMYVKESPEWDEEQSIENYHDFVFELNAQLEKGESLKKYWKEIRKIKFSFLPEITDTADFQFKRRIVERLEMFYGLLKKKYEEFSYSENKFHFSADMLAFITLWSVLNEIQEAYFEKGLGESFTQVKNNSNVFPYYSPIPLDNWKIRNQSPDKYFVVEKPIIEEAIYRTTGDRIRPRIDHIKREPYSDFKRIFTAPFFEFDPSGFQPTRINFKERLFVQIAFFLMAKDRLRTSTKTAKYLQILVTANEERNKLYLTHGEDGAAGFYAQTEKDKPPFSDTITADLFNLISFLLTGVDTVV